MKLIFAHSLVKKEGVTSLEKGWLLKAYKKGIHKVIKGSALPVSSKLIKLYMTTVVGARRAVFLVDLKSGDVFFLLFRSKNDPIGENITIKNPKFKVTLLKYLVLLNEDLSNNDFETLSL